MTYLEFVERHGVHAWETLVEPRQQDGQWSETMRRNANVLVDQEIASFLKSLGLSAQTLVEATSEWDERQSELHFGLLLQETLYSPAYYDHVLEESMRVRRRT